MEGLRGHSPRRLKGGRGNHHAAVSCHEIEAERGGRVGTLSAPRGEKEEEGGKKGDLHVLRPSIVMRFYSVEKKSCLQPGDLRGEERYGFALTGETDAR